jgi:hypothetical protein
VRPLEAADRGAIVGHRGQYGVAWWGDGDRLFIFPIEAPVPAIAGDVPMGADLVLFAGQVIRVSRPIWVPRDVQEWHGAVSGHVIERVAASVERGQREAAHERRWNAHRDGRYQREERCVRL